MASRPSLAWILLLTAALSGASWNAAAQDAAEARVLFIGNSLTSWNDLPLIVEAMAKSRNIALSTESVTYPDVSLEDHWNRGAVKTIRRGGWKYVVLQQGPSSLLESRNNLREWAKRFATEIRGAGAVPAFYMVWPDRSRRSFFPQVREAYRLASEDNGGLFLPAGEGWLTAWQREPGLDLYGPDNFHPSPLGSYAAAAVIFAGLTGQSPEGLPARLKLRSGSDFKVDERKAAVVLEAARDLAQGR